jgi:uncharacterized damage-inducible protein DinB
MQQTDWTNRTFKFDFPEGLFPVIIGRLKGAYPRIADLTEDISKRKLIEQPNGKWSIQEHIGHLTDLEELHRGRIDDFKNYEKILRAWDGLNLKTKEAHHNEKSIDALLDDFYNVRSEFIDALLSFNDAELIRTAIHPRLNIPMRVVDMAFFVAEHDDHHIAKIIEIKLS